LKTSNLLIIPSIIIFFSCNSGNNQVEENSLVLDFPSYSDSIIYLECGSVSDPIEIEIYGDSSIDLNAIDDRLSINFKFNWLLENEWPNKIGITSIDIIKNDNVISNMDFSYVKLEAFMNNDPESKRYEQMSKSVYLQDVNMDSYLDLYIHWNSRGFKSYWLYKPEKEMFEYNEELNYMRPYYIDCNENLIYSFQGGTAWYYDSYAYKINNGQIELYQSLYQEHNENYYLERYKDANGSIIFTDTIYND
tara:strand:+ start:181 stop:927 length:747 start_codon:yes stop_codon:yes gene_type:complete